MSAVKRQVTTYPVSGADTKTERVERYTQLMGGAQNAKSAEGPGLGDGVKSSENSMPECSAPAPDQINVMYSPATVEQPLVARRGGRQWSVKQAATKTRK